MQLNHADRASLLRGLNELSGGAWRRFEDILWLSFGDHWGPLMNHLSVCGYIRMAGQHGDEPKLTAKGHQLIDALRRETMPQTTPQLIAS